MAEPGHEKICLTPYANNKGADQHDISMKPTISGSVAEQVSLCLAWSETPEDTFLSWRGT